MKNKLTDLNDHLFAQMERLNDEDLKGDDLQKELQRTDALTKVSKTIIENASLILDATKLKAEHIGLGKTEMPLLLGSTEAND